jgi:hypothetical protein
MPTGPSQRRHRRLRRRGAIILLGLGAFGLAAASAASLGGLASASLGADNAAVTSCDTNGVSLRYTHTYNTAAGVYRTTTVQVRGINGACRNKSLTLTLGSATASIGFGTIAVLGPGANQTVTLTVAPNAKLVTRAAVVITG